MRDLTIWEDGAREDVITLQRVTPRHVDDVIGEVPHIVLSDCSLTFGYYTDNRVQGSICYEGTWDGDLSYLRLVHECPDYGYRNELATLVIDSITDTSQKGSVKTKLTCQSMLWALADDKTDWCYAIGAGALANDVVASICDEGGFQHLVMPGAGDHRYQQTVVYKIEDSRLSILFDAAADAGNRLDVDGHGRITVTHYTPPAERDPDWLLDANSPRSIVIDEGDDKETSLGDAYGRTIVVYTNGNEQVAGGVEAPSDAIASWQRRGYLRANVHTLNEMNPPTREHAAQIAKSYQSEDIDVGVKRNIKCMYFPIVAGDMVRYIDTAGNSAKYLAQEVTANLADMTVNLTLKREGD